MREFFLPMTQHKRNNCQRKLSIRKKFQNFVAFVYFNLLANIQHARNNFVDDSACGKYILPMYQLAGNIFSEGSARAKNFRKFATLLENRLSA
jgi:hypothetical protein